MREQKYDFDKVEDRRNTNCLKYDFAARRGKPEGVLPLWIADMDFRLPQEVLDQIHQRIEQGIFGYTEVQEDYFEALHDWMLTRHGWEIERKWLVKTPGIVYALAMAVQAFSEPGDGVMIQMPVYYPFKGVIEENGRIVVDNTLIPDEDGRYHMNLSDFEEKITQHKVKLFLFCSPHNPVGRVWTEEELRKLGEICIRHDVLIVSDEIHEDFVFEGHKHTVFSTLSEELNNRIITCTSPGKTFNMAGLQVSNILIANPKIRSQFRRQIEASGYSQLNTAGLVGCEAAYRYGGQWYEELLGYLQGNLDFLRTYLRNNIPDIRLTEPDGTYLIWLDLRSLGLTAAEQEDLITNKAGLWLDSGSMFGASGEGYERINIACPRSILKEALDRLKAAIDDLKKN